MKVKCIISEISVDNSSPEVVHWANNSELEITVGKIYVVFAISKYFDSIYYYILGDESDEYPLAFPSALFEVVDPEISKYWHGNTNDIKSWANLEISNGEIISFKEWTLMGDVFYEKLLEENAFEIALFNSYKDKLLKES